MKIHAGLLFSLANLAPPVTSFQTPVPTGPFRSSSIMRFVGRNTAYYSWRSDERLEKILRIGRSTFEKKARVSLPNLAVSDDNQSDQTSTPGSTSGNDTNPKPRPSSRDSKNQSVSGDGEVIAIFAVLALGAAVVVSSAISSSESGLELPAVPAVSMDQLVEKVSSVKIPQYEPPSRFVNEAAKNAIADKFAADAPTTAPSPAPTPAPGPTKTPPEPDNSALLAPPSNKDEADENEVTTKKESVAPSATTVESPAVADAKKAETTEIPAADKDGSSTTASNDEKGVGVQLDASKEEMVEKDEGQALVVKDKVAEIFDSLSAAAAAKDGSTDDTKSLVDDAQSTEDALAQKIESETSQKSAIDGTKEASAPGSVLDKTESSPGGAKNEAEEKKDDVQNVDDKQSAVDDKKAEIESAPKAASEEKVAVSEDKEQKAKSSADQKETNDAKKSYDSLAAKITQEDKDVVVVDLPKQGLRLWLTKPPKE